MMSCRLQATGEPLPAMVETPRRFAALLLQSCLPGCEARRAQPATHHFFLVLEVW